jgi:hypothetical protein
MSGIYLVVWDEERKDETPVLKTTKGGYPHITVAYTGKELSLLELKETASNVFSQWVLEKVILTKAYVNSFKDGSGRMRHDVLISIDKENEIEETRRVYLKNKYANHDTFFMRTPHVTYGIYEEQSIAERVVGILNKTFLPHVVVVTGVTIN